jgi:hypothetical protein
MLSTIQRIAGQPTLLLERPQLFVHDREVVGPFDDPVALGSRTLIDEVTIGLVPSSPTDLPALSFIHLRHCKSGLNIGREGSDPVAITLNDLARDLLGPAEHPRRV